MTPFESTPVVDGVILTRRQPRLIGVPVGLIGTVISLALVFSGGPWWAVVVDGANLLLWGALFVRAVRAGIVTINGEQVILRSLDHTHIVARSAASAFSADVRPSLLWSPRRVLILRTEAGQEFRANDYASATLDSGWVDEAAALLNQALRRDQ